MSKSTKAAIQYLEDLAHNANNLLAATSDVACDRVRDARERLSDALDGGRVAYKRIRQGSLDGAKIADETVRENPYTSIGVALIVGGIVTFLLTRRRK